MSQEYNFKLSARDKKRFEERMEKIDERDVIEVMTKFGEKLDGLERWLREAKYIPDFLSVFIENLKLMYEMICDSAFNVSWTTKAWTVFALGYFIMPFDLIPDAIPIVGYFDDYAVLIWVMGICSEEIDRYKRFRKSKKASKVNNLVLLQRRQSNRNIIIASGFLSRPEQPKSYDKWIAGIRNVDQTASIYTFIWDTKDITKLLSTSSGVFSKNPFLTAGYSIARLIELWREAVTNTLIYSETLARNVESLRKCSKKKINVSLIGHSLGARLIYNALSISEKGLFNNVYTVGGAIGAEAEWFKQVRKIDRLINCYSERDRILKYLFKAVQRDETPIGLSKIGKRSTEKRIEIDCTNIVSGHSKYADTVEHWY